MILGKRLTEENLAKACAEAKKLKLDDWNWARSKGDDPLRL